MCMVAGVAWQCNWTWARGGRGARLGIWGLGGIWAIGRVSIVEDRYDYVPVPDEGEACSKGL
jgi:hypothetical protein